MVSKKDNAYPILHFPTQKEWEEWLHANFNTVPGVWIKFAKKGMGGVSPSYQEALDVALCYGWIDGQVKRFDEQFWIQKFTPRGPKSMWSKRNVEIVEQLITDKKMQPAGLAAIDAAKADGRWKNAYHSPSNMEVPDDFLKRLQQNKKAYEFYLTLNKANTYAIAWRLQTAKKPETREKRMVTILEMMEKGEKFH